jgi:glucokinase
MSAASPRIAVGIDIGGTKIAAGLVTVTGQVTGPIRRIATPRGADAIVAAVVVLVAELRAGAKTPPEAVGIGSAGTISADGVVVAATAAIPGWAGTALADRVGLDSGLPSFALNDVQAAAVGELRLGPLRDVPTGLLVAIGTGVGGAYVGPSGVIAGRFGRAGSIGHLVTARREGRRCGCGGVDHVEAYASGPAMEQDYRRVTGRSIDLVGIAQRAESGEPAAIDALRSGAEVLGEGLAAMSQAVDPHLIVLAGGVVDIGDRYLETVRDAYRAESVPPGSDAPVVTASLGGSTVLVGAALHALDRASTTA